MTESYMSLIALHPRQLRQLLAGHPADPPVRQHRGTQFLIEINGRPVPVQHRPLQSAAIALPRDLRHAPQQRLSRTGTAVLRHDENILEVDSRSREERRIMWKNRANPIGSPSRRAISASAYARSPKSVRRRSA